MSEKINCCSIDEPLDSVPFKRAVWIALILNAGMFVTELVAAVISGSSALASDSVDFLADSMAYGLTIWATALTPWHRAMTALVKGWLFILIGVLVVIRVGWGIYSVEVPIGWVMVSISVLALLVNLLVAFMLFRFRDGDANRKSIWLCSRNDAIGNFVVIGAGVLVWVSGTGYPDFLVGMILAIIAISAGIQTIISSTKELKHLKIHINNIDTKSMEKTNE